MRTFSVKNFERFQHYKDRNPPWIKLYNELLDDYDFGALPDASKMHLIAIWLLASRSNNKIPYDPEWIGRRINATCQVDLDVLERYEFIVVDQEVRNEKQDASATLADCKQVAMPETEKRQRREEVAPSGAPSAKVYAFESGVIRLKQKDFDLWKASFSHLDLRAELIGLTDWAGQQRSWFNAVSGALAKRNREVKAQKEKPPETVKWNGLEGVL